MKSCLKENSARRGWTAEDAAAGSTSALQAEGASEVLRSHVANRRSIVDVVKEVQSLRAEVERVFAAGAGAAAHGAAAAHSATAEATAETATAAAAAASATTAAGSTSARPTKPAAARRTAR